MYNSEILLDIHARAHESLRRLIVFCDDLTADELRRPLTGFGFPTVLGQLDLTDHDVERHAIEPAREIDR
jgi:hypothetical protein